MQHEKLTKRSMIFCINFTNILQTQNNFIILFTNTKERQSSASDILLIITSSANETFSKSDALFVGVSAFSVSFSMPFMLDKDDCSFTLEGSDTEHPDIKSESMHRLKNILFAFIVYSFTAHTSLQISKKVHPLLLLPF